MMENLEVTVLELRTLRTILKTLVDRKILPQTQTVIIKGILKQIDDRDVGRLN